MATEAQHDDKAAPNALLLEACRRAIWWITKGRQDFSPARTLEVLEDAVYLAERKDDDDPTD